MATATPRLTRQQRRLHVAAHYGYPLATCPFCPRASIMPAMGEHGDAPTVTPNPATYGEALAWAFNSANPLNSDKPCRCGRCARRMALGMAPVCI